ncbi:hypothetical protein V8F33_006858 [Rhypophila sp. PSN 637]
MTETTPLRPVWRHMVGVEGLPWLRDHVVDGLIIFPGAGYMCMALQAAEQLMLDRGAERTNISRMRLQNVAFLKGLVIPDSRARVEVQLVLDPISAESKHSDTEGFLFSVTAYSPEDDQWTEHCRGSVLVDVTSPSQSNGFSKEATTTFAEATSPMSSSSSENITPEELYQSLRKGGNVYGPTFSGIQEFQVVGDEVAISTITTADIPSIMPAQHMQPHIIHPSTLDVLLHTTLPLVSRRLGVVGSVMPVRIDDLVIELDQGGPDSKADSRFTAVTSLTGSGFRSAEADMLVFPVSAGNQVQGSCAPVISVMGMELRSLASSERAAGSAWAGAEGQVDSRDICYEMKWVLDERFLPAENLNLAIRKVADPAPLSPMQLRFIAEPGPGLSRAVTQAIIDKLPSALAHKGVTFTTPQPVATPWINSQPATDQDPSSWPITIILDNGASPVLSAVDSPTFRKIVDLLQRQSNILWVSLSDDKDHRLNPQKHLITGVARTAHAENELLELVTVDVQETLVGQKNCDRLVDFLSELVMSFPTLGSSSVAHEKEREYVYVDQNQVLVPRVIPSTALNRQIQKSNETITGMETFVGIHGRTPLKLDTNKGADSLGGVAAHAVFVEDESHTQPLDQDHVEIEAKAFGVASSSYAGGRHNGPQAFGTAIAEYAGVVIAVGSRAELSSGLKIGDRVVAWAEASLTFASRPRLPASQVRLLPSHLSFSTGAALPVSLMTAYHALVEIAHVKAGQTICIDGAASEIGQAALCMAKSIGAKILVAVGTSDEADLLQEKFGLPMRDILSRESPFLRHQLNKLLGPRNGGGIDVVLACASSAVPSEIVKAQSPFGTSVQIGAGASIAASAVNGTVASLDLGSFLTQVGPTKASRLFDMVMEMVYRGLDLDPLRIASLPMSNLNEALKSAQRHQSMVKYVVEVVREATVKVARPSYIIPKLDADATYVVAGGLGDLGQRFLRLMAKAGARFLVTLSRSGAGEGQHETLSRELQTLSPSSNSCSLLCLKCDVSKELNIQASLAEIKAAGLPPVRGVIQASLVLGDSTLDNMTAQDFDRVLQAKAFGTLHLQKVFAPEGLTFFISLSSAVNMIGSAGQANYNAANSLQDALAQFDRSSDCFYMALNIGLIEDATVNSDVIIQSVQRQGLVTIYHDELDAYFGYSLSAEARQAGCHQAVIGFTPESVARTSIVNGAAKTLMFTHVHEAIKRQADDEDVGGGGAVKTFAEFVAQTRDRDEIEAFAGRAIANKLADLMLIEAEDVELDESLNDFGLDSLIAIELRNWIMRELGSPIQTSEVLGSENIWALARKVTSRSLLVTPGGADSDDPGSTGTSTRSNSEGMAPMTSSTVPTSVPTTPSRAPSQEPPAVKESRKSQRHLPIPDLAETLNMLAESRMAICSPEEKQDMERVLHDFLATDGPELVETLRTNPSSSDERLEFYNHHLHLKRREPLQDHALFFIGHLTEDTVPRHTQAERAAIITGTAMNFKRRLESGSLEQHKLNDIVLCMDTLDWLFHTNQEPGLTTDIAQKYSSNNKVVVMRRGHLFEIDVHPEDDYQALERVFSDIIDASTSSDIPTVSVLTAKSRHEWAALRSQIQSLSPSNAETLSALESCAFIVSLDDSSPETSSERCTSILLNDLHLSNRWLDKMLAFTVASNGVSALLGENTMLDGLSARQLSEYMTEEILRTPTPFAFSQSSSAPMSAMAVSTIRPLSFTTTPALIQTIEEQVQKNLATYHHIDSSREYYPQLSRAFLGSKGMRSKGTVLVAIAMATRLFFGHYEPLWETVTLAKYAKGRIDWLQTLTPEVVEFVDAALALQSDDESGEEAHCQVNLKDLGKRLKEVSISHVQNLQRVADGRGYVEGLYALMGTALASAGGKEEDLPELFRAEVWRQTDRHLSQKRAKTDCLGSGGYLRMQEGGFLMPNPGCLFIHYEVHHKDPLINVSGRKEDVQRFEETLVRCLRTVRKIVEG